jgi:predicted ATP-dependent endonuclease of OLD family
VILEKVRIQNLRSILDETIPCDRLTVLVGPNGSGKSSFLKALDFFYSPSANITEDDFYDRDQEHPIVITVTYCDLTDGEKAVFEGHGYVSNNRLTVTKRISRVGNRVDQKYYGIQMQLPVFRKIREAENKTEGKKEYNKLRQQAKFSELPSVRKADDIEPLLRDWETQHSHECKPYEHEHQFFGYAGPIYLGRFSRFLPIPAVKEASEEASETAKNVLKDLVELVVRSSLAKAPKIEELRRTIKEEYDKVIKDPDFTAQWQSMQGELSKILKTFAPDCDVELHREDKQIEVPLPKANVMLKEDGYASTVDRSGHGLQRAFIMAIFQYFEVVSGQSRATEENGADADQKEAAQPSEQVNLVIGLEEPEIYQHPSRQRHLARVLAELPEKGIPGVGFQIIYSTHSPLFVDIDRFNQIRLFRKQVHTKKKPKVTCISMTSLQEVADQLGVEPEDFRVRLSAIMTPWMNEGFFADLVVLVEGIEDRIPLIGAAQVKGINLESLGVCLVPCHGKGNMDRLLTIFGKFGIDTYATFDGDHNTGNCNQNRKLLQLCGSTPCDWPETTVCERYACFKTKLLECLKQEVGETCFSETCQACYDKYSLHKPQAIKTPIFYKELIERHMKKNKGKKGKSKVTLLSIVDEIVKRVKQDGQ